MHAAAGVGAQFTRADVLNDVRDIIAQQTGMEPARIVEAHSLVADLGCDSLDQMEIAMEAEERFGVVVPDELLARIETVGDVTTEILALLAKG